MKRKRWRPKFSLRLLLILPVLVGLFFVAGNLTRHYGIASVEKNLRNEDWLHSEVVYCAPLLMSNTVQQRDIQITTTGALVSLGETERRYYLWLFGPTIELPYSPTIPDPMVEEIIAQLNLQNPQ